MEALYVICMNPILINIVGPRKWFFNYSIRAVFFFYSPLSLSLSLFVSVFVIRKDMHLLKLFV
jgi:hypothetical protein